MLRLTQRCPAKQHWSWFEETLSVSPGGSPTLTGLQCSHGEAHELTIYNVNSWLFDSVPIPRVLWQHRGGSFFTRHVCPLSPTHLVEFMQAEPESWHGHWTIASHVASLASRCHHDCRCCNSLLAPASKPHAYCYSRHKDKGQNILRRQSRQTLFTNLLLANPNWSNWCIYSNRSTLRKTDAVETVEYGLNVRKTLCGGYAKKIQQNIHILFRILFEIFFF